MRRNLLFAFLLLICTSILFAQQSGNTAPDNTETEIIATMRAIRAASAGRLQTREWHIPRKTSTNMKTALMLKGTGWKKAYELLPRSKDTFFVQEFENTEITFVRDDSGKVTHQLSRTNGQEMSARKLK